MINRIISIVTPSYNQRNFIEDTIQSILSQEGEFYIDYIIMDGGSTDGSVETIKKYELLLQKNCYAKEEGGLVFYVSNNTDFEWNKCKGVSYRWISQRDNGQSHAINNGLKMAQGDIFAYLNSDDYYFDTDVFNKVLNYFLENEEMSMVYGRGYCVNEHKKLIRDFHDNCSTLNFNRDILKRECFVLQPAAFVRTSVFEVVKGLDESLYWCMDWDLWLRISESFNIGFMPHYLGNWRQYEGIKSNEPDYNMFKERFSVSRRYSGFWEYVINKYYYLPQYPNYIKHLSKTRYGSNKMMVLFFYCYLKLLYGILVPAIKFFERKIKKNNESRLAVFTPLEPLQTGIATYCTKLIKALHSKNINLYIDIFVNDGYVPDPQNLGRVRIINHKFFRMNSHYFNSVLYEMGNNYDFHSYMIPFIKKYNGIVEMHDVRNNAIYITLGKKLLNYIKQLKVVFAFNVVFMYPEMVCYIFSRVLKKNSKISRIFELKTYSKSRVIKSSSKLIIRDKSVVNKYQLPKKKCNIIPLGSDVFPLLHEEEIVRLREELGIDRDEFVITSAGIIHNNKRNDKILQALVEIKKTIPNILYIMAGKSAWVGEPIENQVKAAGLDENVRITGWLSDEEWNKYINITDVGINLRSGSAGEHSGSLVNFFERGKPVLVSDYDQYRNYPDDFTFKIPLDDNEVSIITETLIRLHHNHKMTGKAGLVARQYVIDTLDYNSTLGSRYLDVLNLNT